MPSPLSSLIRGPRAALLLAAAALFTPGRASAGCGDYVTILNAPAGSTRHADQLPAAAAESPAPTKPPCHGPNCSGSPAREFPPLAPVAPVGPYAKEIARHLITHAGADPDPGSSFDRDTTSPRPVRRTTSIFHPPRRS